MTKKQRKMIDDKFNSDIIIKLIPNLENNEHDLLNFIHYFKSFFENEKKFIKFITEQNRYYIEELIKSFYEYFLEEQINNK